MLSILVVNWNTRDLLLACLRSIEAFPPKEPHEVIVVDNSSTDGSAEAIKSGHPSVTIISNDKNVGYAAANNRAFERATGDWLLTLNPDTEVFEDTLQKAIDKLGGNPKFGTLGARQIGTDGKTQRSIRGFPSLLGIVGDITGLGKLFPNSALGSYRLTGFNYEKEQVAPQPMGTFLLMRRCALQSVGDPSNPFDESFPIFFNEVDLLFRMKQAGWPCLYSPDVRIKHHGGESTKQVRKSMIWESHRSLVRFFKKHHQSPWSAPGMWLLAGIIYLAAFVRAKGYDAGFRA